MEFFRGNVFAEHNSFLPHNTIDEIWGIAMEREAEILRQNGKEKPSHIEKDEIFNPIMKDYMVHHPFRFAVKILKQIPAFWMCGETTKKSIVFMLLALSALVFFIKGFLVLRKTSIFAYVVLITVIYFNLLYAAILAWGRYSMPIYPPMLIICLYGIVQHVIKRGKVAPDLPPSNPTDENDDFVSRKRIQQV